MTLSATQQLSNFGSGNWWVSIPGLEEVVIKLVKFEIPEVTAGVTAIGNRTEFILQTSGDHIQYDNLSLEFIMDENLRNYIKLYGWMRSNVHTGIDEPLSIFVHFLGNDKKFQGVEVEFYEAFPISLSKVDLDTNSNETDVICTVTFAYTAFDFIGTTVRN